MERIPLLGNTLRETMLAKDFSFTMMDAKYLCICRRAKHMLSVSQIQQTCHQHQKQTCHQHQKQTCHQHLKQTCHQHQKQQQKQLWNEWSTAMCDHDICLQRFLWFCCQTERDIFIHKMYKEQCWSFRSENYISLKFTKWETSAMRLY